MSCPLARASLNDLTRALLPQFPRGSFSDLKRTLDRALNKPVDRAPDGSPPYESISRAEASHFIKEAQADFRLGKLDQPRVVIMGVLQQWFFAGRTSWEYFPAQPKFPAPATRFADGDTITSLVSEDLQCPPLLERLRFGSVDTPESKPSEKLSRMTLEVAAKLSEAHRLPSEWLPQLLPLVRFRIQYVGELAALVMKDFGEWLTAQGGHFWASNSYSFSDVYYDEKNQPLANKYYGLWEAYDKFLRRLVTLHAPAIFIPRYFQERLPQLMREQGALMHQSWSQRYAEMFKEAQEALKISTDALNFLSPATMVKPHEVFDLPAGQSLAHRWQTEVDRMGAGDDWTAALIFLGLGYYYPKYRNQHGEIYKSVHLGALTNRVGLWSDPVFLTMNRGPSLE